MMGDEKVNYGFLMPCDPNKSGNLQIKWNKKDNRFDLKKVVTATCLDDPAILPNPARDGFDTHRGTGTGKYNGSSGATVEWTFTDAGKSGNNDTAAIIIKDAVGNIVLSFSGTLNEKGDNKTHK